MRLYMAVTADRYEATHNGNSECNRFGKSLWA